MPGQTGKSGLAAKLRANAPGAAAKHAGDDITTSGGGSLPAGLVAIARVSSIKFGIFKEGKNAGQFFYMAAGTIVSPEFFNGIPVKGSRTQVGPEPLCDTPDSMGKRKTAEDHVAYVQNEFKKLGVDMKNGFNEEMFEPTALALTESKPYFKMHTFSIEDKPQPGQKKSDEPPRVFEAWDGACPYTDEEGAGDHMHAAATQDDSTGSEEVQTQEAEGSAPWESDNLDDLVKAANEDSREAKVKLTEMAKEKGHDADKISTWEEVAELIRAGDENAGDDGNGGSAAADWAAIGKAADGDGADAESARESLEKEAAILGLDPDDYTDSWESLGDAIAAAGGSGGSDAKATAAAPADDTPGKGDVYGYKPSGKGKPLDCQIMSVNSKMKTAVIQRLDDGKTQYKDVPWTRLTPVT